MQIHAALPERLIVPLYISVLPSKEHRSPAYSPENLGMNSISGYYFDYLHDHVQKKKKKKNVNYIPKIHGVSLWISSFLKLSQTAIPANIGSNLAVLCLKMAVTVTLLNCVHEAHFTTVIPFYPPPVQVSYNTAIVYRAKTELN